jgi:hypothetical protein
MGYPKAGTSVKLVDRLILIKEVLNGRKGKIYRQISCSAERVGG